MSNVKFDAHYLNSKNWFIMGTPRGSNLFGQFRMSKKQQWMWKQRLKSMNLQFASTYGDSNHKKEGK